MFTHQTKGGFMFKKSLLFLFIIILGTSGLLFGQQDYLLNGSGARAAGMGYAFTGVADDASAISWNSAGLTQLYSPEASIVARFGFGSLEPDYDMDFNVETGSKFQLNFASLALPFNVGNFNVVGGIAYRRVFDFTQDITITAENLGTTVEAITDNSGGVDAISPAIGFQLNEMVSFGAAINIYTGSTDYMSEMKVNDVIFAEGEYSEEYSGTAIDLGVLVKASPQFTIGANLNLPHTLTIEEDDYEYDMDIPFFFSIGTAFRASDNLTIAADYRSRSWSNLEVDGEKVEYVEDANSIHVGLEYLASAGNNVMPLRFGFYTAPTPDIDENEDQIAFNALTAGIGIIMGSIILDGSFEYMFGSYVGDTENGADVDYKVSDFRVTVGGVIHFGE